MAFKKRLIALLAALSVLCTLTGPAVAAAESVTAGPIDLQSGSFTVTAVLPPGLQAEAVRFPVWSQPDQNDIIWHDAVCTNGTWTTQIKISDHGWNLGPYQVHCYALASDGSQTLVGGTSVTAASAANGSLSIAPTDSSQTAFALVLKDAEVPAGCPVAFRVLTSDGSLAAQIPALNLGTVYAAQVSAQELGANGTYIVQACLGASGSVLAQADLGVSGAQGSRLYIENVDGHQGTFRVIAGVRSRTAVQAVQAAVWTEPDQSDLKWITLDRAGDQWVATVNVRDFGRHFGTYTVHAYALLENGLLSLIDGAAVEMSPEDYLYSEANTDGTYMLRLLGASPTDTVLEADVWSAVYGKDDLRRYELSPAGDGVWELCVDPENHPSGRTLEARIYRGETQIGSVLCPEAEALIGTTSLAAEERLQREAEAVYAKVGTDLHEVYKYVRDSLSYVSRDGHIVPPEGYTRQQWYAVEGLETFHGNCFTFASSFYELAKRLGYEVQYVEGEVPSVNGNWIPHGFVLLTVDGQTYICDAVFEHSSTTGRNYYMQPIERPRTTYRW